MTATFDEPALTRFDTEEVIWLTTVRSDGQPQSSPVWFVWDDEDQSFLIYSQPDVGKLHNITSNPAVSLHLDGGVENGSTTIVEGGAQLSDDPRADHRPDFVTKYDQAIARSGWTPASVAADYSVPFRVHPTRVRSW